MNKLLVLVLLLASLASCASGPPTGADGFEIRHTGLNASLDFWNTHLFNVDNNNPYATAGDSSPMSSPGSGFFSDSFYEMTYSHREQTEELYERRNPSASFKAWVLNNSNSPYGSND
ncbi:MAG: hypothetical protein H8E25_02405 [Planctomycetes bacterium]|nr:hypothetical protein [Planctomycetota bacterium]